MDKSRVAHMAYAPLGQGNRSEMFKEPAVLALAEKYGKTPAQIQLRFLTQKGIAVIPRSTQPAHIRENFALFDFALTDAEMQEITTLNKDKRYYEVTEDKLAAFATMFPPVDDQK